MLLNKSYFLLIFIISSLLLYSCKEKEEPVDIINQLNNPEYILSQAKKAISNNVQKTFKGNFLEDSLMQIVAGEEIENKSEWGIKFYLLTPKEKVLEVKDNTNLLKGSFTDCLLQTMKFPSYNYELIYYNSLNFFLGSGGGEVFSYIIDFNRDKTQYAHLFTDPEGGVSLYISDNTEEVVKNFFISNFKRDYPSLQLVSEDVDMEL